MNFRTTVLLGLVTLAVGSIVAVTIGVGLMIDHASSQEAAEGLSRTRQSFEGFQAYSTGVADGLVKSLAEEPRLKEAVATGGATPEEVLGVLRDLRRVLQADLLVILDARGQALADPGSSSGAGQRLANQPLTRDALATGKATEVWLDGDQAFQLYASRLQNGASPTGVVLLGYLVNDRAMQTLSRHLASPVVITLDGKVIAASALEGDAAASPTQLSEGLAPALGTEAPTDVQLAGRHYLAISAPFPGYHGPSALRFTVLRSLDQALATGRHLIRLLLVIIAGVAALVLVLAVALARRLGRPLDALLDFTHQVARGDYTVRAVPRGTSEMKALAESMNQMVEEVDKSRKQLAAQERLEREMEIASHLQTAILPRELNVHGLEIAARMMPATEVGGDYYDVLPVDSGAYIGIGDVAGHGITAGVMMVMIQNAMAALVRDNPQAAPRELICRLNDVIYENIRKRMRRNEHATLSLLRYHPDGQMVYAGAHEELIVCRAATGRCERLPVQGTWVGAMRNVERFTVDVPFQLRSGDLLVLYSDGITEAMNAAGEQFGMERLCAEIEKRRQQPAEQICGELLQAVTAWCTRQADDMTAMVIRYQGAPPPERQPGPTA